MANITSGKFQRASRNIESVRDMIFRNMKTTRRSLTGMKATQKARDQDMIIVVNEIEDSLEAALELLDQAAALAAHGAERMRAREPKG